MTNIKKDILWRAGFCLFAVVLFAVWIAGSMFKVQITERDKWLSLSDSLTIKEHDISPARGNIYSANGSLLATSMPIYEIRWDATVVNADTFRLQVSDLAIELSKLFPEKSAAAYKTMLIRARRDKNRYVLIRRKANYHEQKRMREFPIFRNGRYKGGFISMLTTKRVRPAGLLAFRTIGYRTESNPGVGLERSYEKQLGGTKGKRLVQRISGGWRPLNNENLIEPENGKDIYTTINVDFQEITQRALSAGLERTNAKHGCVVIMEVETGKIRAISNLENKGDGSFSEQYNYAIGESYEPGSVWKVFSAMAAIEDGVVRPEDSLKLYGGKREYFGQKMLDAHQGNREKTTFKDAFAQSSNVVLSSLIYDNYQKEPADYIGYLKKLNLHKPTGIEILGEGEPFLNQPSSSSWSNIALPWLAIGYENKHTPLQLLTSYNGIINNGNMVSPLLVEKITDAGIVVQDNTALQQSKRVCSESTSQVLRELTAEVFVSGTGKSSKSTVVALAGKTGTAQIANSRRGYQNQTQYNASFAGHFPAESPVYSVYVMVHRPQNGFYATTVAVPIFKEIAEKIYTISVNEVIQPAEKKFYPTYTNGYYSDFKTLNPYFQFALASEVTNEIVSINTSTRLAKDVIAEPGKMPNVLNMGARDAMYLLESLGVQVVLKGAGKVVEQSPKSGEAIRPNRKVYIRLQ